VFYRDPKDAEANRFITYYAHHAQAAQRKIAGFWQVWGEPRQAIR
jgi:hypothetical protein